MMPAQRPGASKQDYGTPKAFLEAVEKRFGKLVCDLAARADNSVCKLYLDPRCAGGEGSLAVHWHAIASAQGGPLWLNPPFGKIAPWAKKCAEESSKGAEILLLVPASVGANWYWDYVAPYATVYSIGRLTFEGQAGKPGPFPKDLILAHYCQDPDPQFLRWQWHKKS